MNKPSNIIELRSTKSMEEAFYKLPIPIGIESLLIVDESTVFTLYDEQNNKFSDVFNGIQPFVTIRFKAHQMGLYKGTLKGFDSKLNEVCVYNLVGLFSDTRFSYNVKYIFVAVSVLFFILYLHDGLKIYYNPSRTNSAISTKHHKILFIGSTEKYCDPDVLLNRFQRYYDITIDCETYSNRSLKELLRLLHEGKISCIVTSMIDFNTSSVYWSDVYAIDNSSGNGLRLGVLKSESNVQLIRQFNE